MISLVMGTRDRPGNLSRWFESIEATAGAPCEVVLRLDDDDPQLDSMRQIAETHGAQVLVGPRGVLSDLWTETAHASHGGILWCQDDEVVFRSEGWAPLIEAWFAQFDDGLAVAGADEGYTEERASCCPIISRRWFEITGHTFPLGFDGDWGDNWVHDVARAAGRPRGIIPGVRIEQLAVGYGKAERDATHIERQERQETQDVYALFVSRAAERDREAAAIREAIN